METQNVPPATPTSTPSSVTPTHLAIGAMPSLQQLPQIRDPEWLKLEICREFQRGSCKRSADECKYAHPSKHIQVASDGKVIACYDALKGKCSRDTCKYLHPTNQLKQQLEINGKQALMQNRTMLQQMVPIQPTAVHGAATLPQGGLVGYEQLAAGNAQPLASGLPANQFYSQTVPAAASAAYSVLQPSDLAALNPQLMPYYQIAAAPAPVAAMLPAAGSLRADKLEVCRDFQRGNCTRGEMECRYGHPPDRSMIDMTDNTVTVCMDCIKGRCTREKCKYFHPPSHLQAKIRAAQNPGTAFLTSLGPAAMAGHQPTVMMTNGNPLGQPPLKRHALDSSMMTSGGNSVSNTSGITLSTASTQQTLSALYGYNSAALSGLTSVHHQSLPAAPTYYQQTIPMLQLQYGANALAAAASPAPTAPFTTFNLPTSSSTTANGNVPSYALLNGHNQLAGELSSEPAARHVTNASYAPLTMTVCRDYQSGKCTRQYCRFVHVHEDCVEVKDDRVTICRNAIEGKCLRAQCKFYHMPSAPDVTAQSTSYLDLSYGEAPAVGAVTNRTTSGLIPVIANGPLPTMP